MKACCLVALLAVSLPIVFSGEAAALRTRLGDHFFVPDPLPELAVRVHRRFQPAPGVAAEALTYATQLGMRVPAILYRPDPLPAAGTCPAFVVVNGHGGDKYSWYAYFTGIAFARAGFVVLTYDPAGEGERNSTRRSGTREHDRLQGDAVLARRLAGLMITDARQAVALLAGRPEVDRTRMAAGGYSMGSFVLALAGAIEPRLRAVVLVGGGNLDGIGGYWDRSKAMCQGLPYRSLEFLGDRAAALYALHAARGPLLIWNGRADTVVNMPNTQDEFFTDLQQRVAVRHGSRQTVFDFGFTPTASHRPYWLTEPVARWLGRQLRVPAWTADPEHPLPTTHIATWAQRTGAAMDRLYATEEREGGTRAVGVDVPGIAREELSVLSVEEWERAKPSLVFEMWVARARQSGG
ncbi:MAG: acetylxylan esterase [Verrucomicrobia bacterium]|nr:acetylxylan esterase [Verrucomicrobiota bacterium]